MSWMPQQKDKDWLNGYKNKTPIYAEETNLKTRDTWRLKVKGWKKIFLANRDQKKAGEAILTSEKIDFEIKTMKRWEGNRQEGRGSPNGGNRL